MNGTGSVFVLCTVYDSQLRTLFTLEAQVNLSERTYSYYYKDCGLVIRRPLASRYQRCEMLLEKVKSVRTRLEPSSIPIANQNGTFWQNIKNSNICRVV